MFERSHARTAMRHWYIVLLLVAAGAQPASAQSFAVVSTQPADHAAGVPLQTTLAFTFSQRVFDYANGFNAIPPLVAFPAAAVNLGPPVRSADGLTLSFRATLQPDTRYVFLLIGADAEVDGLRASSALNITTAATTGTFTVRGHVSGVGRLGLAPGGSIVALVTGDLATGDVQILSADVVEGDGERLPYSLGPVPLGLYTAAAVRLPIGSTTPIGRDGYGLYDPDGDGTPNPIFATSGIDIALASPPPRAANEGADQIQTAADETVGAGAVLTNVFGDAVNESGASAGWRYTFQGARPSRVTGVTVLRYGLLTLPLPYFEDFLGRPGLPFPLLLDSGEALRRADADVGNAFRALDPRVPVSVRMTAQPEGLGTPPRWLVGYTSLSRDQAHAVVRLLPVAAETGPVGAPRRLTLRSANPARGAVEAMLTLDAPAHAHVAVVDALGRTVARLADGPLPAGATPLRWTPGADTPAGTYWIVARTGTRAEALTVTRVR